MPYKIQKLLSLFKVYGFAILLIGCWWTVAFRQKSPHASMTNANAELTANTTKELSIFLPTAVINRQALKQALGGDYALMTRMIADWDIEAQLLEAKGIDNIQRLPKIDFLRSQMLGRALAANDQTELRNLRRELNINEVVDDAGSKISLKTPYMRFLPQTYTSASFLLALVSPSQIIALPGRLREQTELYPKELTDKILLDIDRHNSEQLFEKKPEIAFVAHYSHPSILQALRNQGVILYMMKDLNTLQDIGDELLNVGRIVNRPFEAELSKYFLAAASLALDNKLMLQSLRYSHLKRALPKVLYVNHHHNFSIPTSNTLIGHLLKKIAAWDISLPYTQAHGRYEMWTLPIDKEHIVNLNPDCIIIATEHPLSLEREISQDVAFKNVNAVKNRHFYFVDECIQQSPCQYILLAYFDIIDALSRIE